MLVFGDYRCLPILSEFKVYNLSSLVEGHQSLELMPSLEYLSYIDDETFDQQYANCIINNDQLFMEFMKVILDLYYGTNVFILVTMGDDILGNNVFDRITDSLIKFINLRYGYTAYWINDPDDLNDDIRLSDQTGFQIYGLNNLDIDKTRYLMLKQNQRTEEM